MYRDCDRPNIIVVDAITVLEVGPAGGVGLQAVRPEPVNAELEPTGRGRGEEVGSARHCGVCFGHGTGSSGHGDTRRRPPSSSGYTKDDATKEKETSTLAVPTAGWCSVSRCR